MEPHTSTRVQRIPSASVQDVGRESCDSYSVCTVETQNIPHYGSRYRATAGYRIEVLIPRFVTNCIKDCRTRIPIHFFHRRGPIRRPKYLASAWRSLELTFNLGGKTHKRPQERRFKISDQAHTLRLRPH